MAMAMCNRLSKCQAHRHEGNDDDVDDDDANGLCHMNLMKLNSSHTVLRQVIKLWLVLSCVALSPSLSLPPCFCHSLSLSLHCDNFKSQRCNVAACCMRQASTQDCASSVHIYFL